MLLAILIAIMTPRTQQGITGSATDVDGIYIGLLSQINVISVKIKCSCNVDERATSNTWINKQKSAMRKDEQHAPGRALDASRG